MQNADITHLAETYASHVDRGLFTIAARIGVHSRFFTRLRDGYGCHVDTYRQVMTWFDANWPADLEWPRDIPRPRSPKKKEAA